MKDAAAGKAETANEGEGETVEEVDVGVEPPSPEFILELPNISSIDLCVVSFLYSFSYSLSSTQDIKMILFLYFRDNGSTYIGIS